jgi:hypothetical protein
MTDNILDEDYEYDKHQELLENINNLRTEFPNDECFIAYLNQNKDNKAKIKGVCKLLIPDNAEWKLLIDPSIKQMGYEIWDMK